jgi:hypothetical protein
MLVSVRLPGENTESRWYLFANDIRLPAGSVQHLKWCLRVALALIALSWCACCPAELPHMVPA